MKTRKKKKTLGGGGEVLVFTQGGGFLGEGLHILAALGQG